MFSFTKKSFSFKVYITGNREFLPRNHKFALSILPNFRTNSLFHTVKYKNHSVGYIFHSVGYKSRNAETENRQAHLKEYFRRKKNNRLHALWILHLKNKKRVYEPCNSSYTPIYRDCELSSVVYHTFTRFSGATYNGSDGVMWKASYQA